MSLLMLKGVIRNGRVETNEPIDLPEGTEVVVTSGDDRDDGPMSAEEIARVQAAMEKIQPLDIPDDVAADLDEWERKVNQYSIDNAEKGLEDVFR